MTTKNTLLLISTIIGLLLPPFNIACNATSSADSLSRPLALRILKEQGDKLLSDDNRLVYLPILIRAEGVKANDDEISRRVPLDHSTLPKGQCVDLKFVDIAEKNGLLRLDYLENITRYNYLMACYNVVPSPDLTPQIPYMDNIHFERAIVVMARPYVTRIIGILEEGREAQVEAEIAYSPTETYRKLIKCAEQLKREEGDIDLPDTNNFGHFWNQLLAANQKLADKSVKKFYFQKYDNDWRITKQ